MSSVDLVGAEIYLCIRKSVLISLMAQTRFLKTCLICPQEQTDLKNLKNTHLEVMTELIANHSHLFIKAGAPTWFSTWPP